MKNGIDLSQKAGLSIGFDRDLERLFFTDSLVSVQPDIRTWYQMISVLSKCPHNTPKEFYQMYRGLGNLTDLSLLDNLGLRFDVTVIPPRMIGTRGEISMGGKMPQEYIKTLGHSHAMPEVYEVLHGEAIYLMQDSIGSHSFAIHAKPGEKVIIPSFEGHVTINPGDDYLIMANFISSRTVSEYESFKEMGGAMHFFLNSGEKNRWIANPNYAGYDLRDPVGLNAMMPLDFYKSLGFSREEPMYTSSKRKNFQNLNFLKKPLKRDSVDI